MKICDLVNTWKRKVHVRPFIETSWCRRRILEESKDMFLIHYALFSPMEKACHFFLTKLNVSFYFFCNLPLGQEEKMEMQKVSSNDDDKISIRKARLI